MLPFAHLNRFQFRHIMKLKNGGAGMRDKKYHLYVDSQDRSILLHSLVALKNQLIQQGRYTDCVDELIVKVTTARIKRIKIKYS